MWLSLDCFSAVCLCIRGDLIGICIYEYVIEAICFQTIINDILIQGPVVYNAKVLPFTRSEWDLIGIKQADFISGSFVFWLMFVEFLLNLFILLFLLGIILA